MDATPPNDDPAARFRKPADAAAKQAAAPVPSSSPGGSPAPGFFELLEDTVAAPVGLGVIFGKLSKAETPGFGAMLANVGVFTAGFLAINILRARLTFPEAASQFPADKIGIGAAVIFGAMLFSSFLAAGVLHAASKAAGGNSDYQRSYLALSLLSAFLPTVAAAHAFPYGWIAAALFWTYLTIEAVEHLHGSAAGATRGVFWTMAVALIAAGFYVELQAQKAIDLYIAPLKAMAQLRRQQEDAQSTQAFQQAVQGLNAPPAAQAPADPAAQLQQMQQFMIQAQELMKQGDAAQAGQPQGSSLDMISQPSDTSYGARPAAPASSPETQRNSAAFQASAAKTVSQLMPMLTNPAILKNMPPEQAKQLQQMMGMLNTLQDQMRTGKSVTPEQLTQMRKITQEQMKSMSQTMGKVQLPQAAPPQQQGSGGQ